MPVSKPNPNYVPPGDRGAAREDVRSCSHCTGGWVTVMRQDGVNAKGKPVYKNETEKCKTCGGSGVR